MSFAKLFKKKHNTEKSSLTEPREQAEKSGNKNNTEPVIQNGNGTLELNNGNAQHDVTDGKIANGHHHHHHQDHSNGHLPLETALLLVGDDQPRVARSTPRGQVINTSRWSREREMAYCLYDRPVYDAMIENSLKAVEMLQENLDCFVTEVRKSPVRETTPPQTTSLVSDSCKK